jgi:type I restriction enzyme S subunit
MIFNKSRFNSDWNTLSLDDLGTFKRGKSKQSPRNDRKLFENGSFPLVQTGEIKEANLYLNKHTIVYNEFGLNQSKLWPENTLCIAIAAHIAETAILKYPMCFPYSIVGFNSFENKSDVCFVNYIFEYVKRSIQNAASGSIQDNINIDFLTKLIFKIPDFRTQSQITKVLSDLDAKIELNNKINAELEAMAKLIYDYWFLQFDFPNQNGKAYKSTGGKMVWNEELKRELPQRWVVKNLFDACKVQYGFPFSTDYFNTEGNGKPVIRIRNILENSISNFSTQEEVDPKYEIKQGDLLIGMDGNFHINYWSKDNCYVNQRVVKLSETILPSIYLRYQVEPYIQLREKSVSRTTVGHLSDKDLKAITILIPEKETLIKSREFYQNTLKEILTNQNQNQKLSELRDWLLPMLMNEQVRVG